MSTPNADESDSDEFDSYVPMDVKAKKHALHLMRRGMDMSGQWRHEEALGHFERALKLVPTGRFARMALELKLATLRTLGRDAEADALRDLDVGELPTRTKATKPREAHDKEEEQHDR